jgi:hypothetical protein
VCIDKDDNIETLLLEEAAWLDLFYYCVEHCALHLQYIVSSQWDDLSSLQENIVAEIVSKAIQFHKADPHYEAKCLIRLVMKLKHVDSVFMLLKFEREQAIQKELEYRRTKRREPILTWSVKNIS